MLSTDPQTPSRLKRFLLRLARTRLGTMIIAPVVPRLDRYTLRRSKGKRSFTSVLTGLPIITMHYTGVKTGISRIVPTIGIPVEDSKYLIIASNWGRSNHPGWYHNFLANPNLEVEKESIRNNYNAVQVSENERDKYWQIAIQAYRGYNNYEKRVKGKRIIHLFLLEPHE